MSFDLMPKFAWPAKVPDAPVQAIAGADRPWYALSACFAAAARGAALMGAARNLLGGQAAQVMITCAEKQAINQHQLWLWAEAINGARLGRCSVRAIGGIMLDPYQSEAVEKLTVAGGVLNMAVGLGKTVTAGAAATTYVVEHHARSTRCWIVAPLVAHGAWVKVRQDLRQVFEDVQVISIDSVHKLVGASATGGVLILDEAHYAGRMDARRTKALLSLRLGFDVGLCLTGTLLHAGPQKAFTVLDLAVPGANPFATTWKAGEYLHCLAKKAVGSRTVTALVAPAGENRKRFLEIISQYTVALTKHSPSVRSTVTIPEQELHTVSFAPAGETVDDCIVRIAQSWMATHPDDGVPSASAVAHLALREGIEAKMDWLADQMEDNDEPVVIFAHYRESLDAVEKWVKENCPAGNHVRIDGDTPPDERGIRVAAFQAGVVRVFIGQTEAAGAAINLYRAIVSVCVDLPFTYETYPQLLGRTCRRGQTMDCHHFDLPANALQELQLKRLRAGESFHLSLSQYQSTIEALIRPLIHKKPHGPSAQAPVSAPAAATAS